MTRGHSDHHNTRTTDETLSSRDPEVGSRTAAPPATAGADVEDVAGLMRLHTLSVRLTASGGAPREVLDDVLAAVVESQGGDFGTILLHDAARGDLALSASVGFSPEACAMLERVPYGVGPCGTAVAERRRVIIEDVEADPAFPFRAVSELAGFRAVYSTPLLTMGGEVLGTLAAYFAVPHRPSAREIRLVELYAQLAAGVIAQARLHDAQQAALAEAEAARAAAEVELIERQRTEHLVAEQNALLERIAGGHLVEESLTEVTRAVARLAPGTRAAILLADEARAKFQSISAADIPSSFGGGLKDAPINDLAVGTCGTAVYSGQPIACADIARDEHWSAPWRELCVAHGILACHSEPVIGSDGMAIASVMLCFDTPRAPSAWELRIAHFGAHLASIAVERDRVMGALRESEEKFRATFANAITGMALTDLAGHYVQVNAAYCALTGYSEQELYATDLFAVTHPEDRARNQAQIERLLAETIPGFVISKRYVRKDGAIVWVRNSVFLVRDGQGRPREIGAVVEDITERKRLEEERARLLEQERQARAEAEGAEARLHTVLDILPVGVGIVDRTGKPMLVNDAVRQVWGDNLLMAKGQEHYGAYKAWHAATGALVAADEWGLARALTDGEVSLSNEYDIETFDGQRKVILDSAVPIRDEAGAIAGAVSVIVDITERRRLERRTREALSAVIAITQALAEGPDEPDTHRVTTADAAPDAASAVDPAISAADDPEAHVLARRLAELTRGLLGCTRVAVSAVEEVDGQLYDRPLVVVGLPPEQERAWWAEQLALQPHALGTGMQPDDVARFLMGEVLTFDLTQPPYQVPNDYGITALLGATMRLQGRVVGVLALDYEARGGQQHIFTPEEIEIAAAVARLGALVLERDRLMREWAEAQARELVAVEAARRMDAFLSIASHELRTPLTTIKMNLQLAERRAEALRSERLANAARAEDRGGRTAGDPARQLSRLLNTAVGAAERQERLVLDLLDVSRIAAGKMEYRMVPFDLAALAREVIEEQQVNAPARTLQVTLPHTPMPVYADPDRIRQVLANYLTNALKYSPAEAPVALTLRRQHGRGANQPVRVEVHDEGPGLSAEQQGHLFERFHRVPGIEVQGGSAIGLGLGLYICKTIIEQHHGAIGVESVPGQGSTFWFTLPIASAASDQPDTPDASDGG